jgi:DNA modification methylase
MKINNQKTIENNLHKNGYHIEYGDSLELIEKIPDNSIKLFYGSPPYPNATRNYANWSIENYINTISPFVNNILPKMKDDGFIVINVKANRTKGNSEYSSERSLIIEELMLYLKKKFNLYCVDIEIWIKTNPVPTGVRVACQDAYEYNIWFSKSKKWKINIDNIRRDYSKNSIETYENAIFKPRKNGLSYVSKEKKIEPNSKGALPLNIIKGAVSSKSLNHQAVQPEYLPEKYIKACTKPGDIVFDPWLGSGTTGVVSVKNNRKFIGFDIVKEYVEISHKEISKSLKG